MTLFYLMIITWIVGTIDVTIREQLASKRAIIYLSIMAALGLLMIVFT